MRSKRNPPQRRAAVALTPEAVERFGRRQKALRIVASPGRLTRLDHLSVGLTEVFPVEGDHANYRTTLYGTPGGPRTATCTCPTRPGSTRSGICSHMLAAKALSEVALDLDGAAESAAVIA
jgi:hypothetical protein